MGIELFQKETGREVKEEKGEKQDQKRGHRLFISNLENVASKC